MPHAATHVFGEWTRGSQLADGQIWVFVANLLSGGTFLPLHLCIGGNDTWNRAGCQIDVAGVATKSSAVLGWREPYSAPTGSPDPVDTGLSQAWIWQSMPGEWDECDCPRSQMKRHWPRRCYMVSY